MYLKSLKFMSATILLMLGVPVTQAGLLEIVLSADPYQDYVAADGPDTDHLPLGAIHDVAETQGAIGWYNANLYATADVVLSYEYVGFEAGWTNSFFVDDELVFANKGAEFTAVESTATSISLSGMLIDFAFQTIQKNNLAYTATVENGKNVAPIGIAGPYENGKGAPNFFLGYYENDASSNSVYIALDDGGGTFWKAGSIDDDNHDDLVIKVTARIVPEPSTLFLLGLGLAGLLLARRKVFSDAALQD
ncbi:MAG: PEP-CTERM sorting domain-containing protein [Pseudomonadales bacterium]|nr:PEP-CTERM sorting domain-containing protein [Pseudomonadales bacterium]